MKIKFFKLKKEKHFKKESSWIDLTLYWELAVFIMIISTFVSLYGGYYLFMQINQEQIVLLSESGQAETVKKERINKVLEFFSVREEKSNQILNSSAIILDPSL